VLASVAPARMCVMRLALMDEKDVLLSSNNQQPVRAWLT
jgi:hypothetical protein